jgi:adenine-specific DNA-methyltransferase
MPAKKAVKERTRKGEPVSQTSLDFAAHQAARLIELFPECTTEGRVDLEKLRLKLGDEIDDRPERYSFTWAGKREAIRLLQIPTRATLIPSKEESINFEKTQNLFIEADNLEALKLLYKAYAGRVKMI